MRKPGSWHGKVWSQGIPQSHRKCSSLQFCFRERFPQNKCNNSAPAGVSFPSKVIRTLPGQKKCYSLLRSPLECNKSTPLGNSFPGKVLQLWSAPALVKVVTAGFTPCHGEHVIPAQETSLKGFTRKGEARRVAASRARSSNRLNRVQSFYKVSWGQGGVFQSGSGLVEFCRLFLGQTRELVGFCAQGLEEFRSLTL